MSTETFDAALAMPEAERARLAYQLLQSLRPPHGLGTEDDDFGAELDRRMERYEAGKTAADTWKNASQRILQALDERSSS